MQVSDSDRAAMDAAWQAEEYEERGKSLFVLGWVVGCMGGITGVWIWVGWRAGSDLWLWYTLGLGLVGAMLAGRGTWLRARSAALFAGISGKMLEGPVSRPETEERRAA
jgi:hypothetical protein